MNEEEFRQYMLCGHGRCFSVSDNELEKYRDTVLYGCLNDISYDLQCEGSRGYYMYELVCHYEDSSYFLEKAAEKFLSSDIDTDWHLICHLCDFISSFAYDCGDRYAEKALEERYSRLYEKIISEDTDGCGEFYEYLAMTLMENSGFERSVKILENMGNIFIHLGDGADEDEFLWFFHCICEKFGKEYLSQQLGIIAEDNEAIKKICSIMLRKDEEKTVRKATPSADEFIGLAENGSVSRRDVLALRRADSSEKIKIANAVISEKDLNKKAELLSAFTIRYDPFPLSPEILIDYYRSENEALHNSAANALLYVKADCVHSLAADILKNGCSTEAVLMLINNYRESDKEALLDILNNIEIDCDNKSGWHDIVLEIVSNFEILPDEFVFFVYERSMCSSCRWYSVKEMIGRSLFTEQLRQECLMDCNEDIRELAESYPSKLYR